MTTMIPEATRIVGQQTLVGDMQKPVSQQIVKQEIVEVQSKEPVISEIVFKQQITKQAPMEVETIKT
jgi:hypothetical protein